MTPGLTESNAPTEEALPKKLELADTKVPPLYVPRQVKRFGSIRQSIPLPYAYWQPSAKDLFASEFTKFPLHRPTSSP